MNKRLLAISVAVVTAFGCGVSFAGCGGGEKAHAHRYGEPAWAWAENAEGGYTASAEYTCSDCNEGAEGHVKVIAASVTATQTAPTCGRDGFTSYVAVCGEDSDTKIVYDVGTKTGEHRYENGVCTVCGEEQPEQPLATCTFALNAAGDGYTVTGIEKAGDILEIPSTYEGLPVTAVGNGAFEKSLLRKLVLGENVKKLGDDAFSESASLAEIDLKNVETLGTYAFYKTAITELNIPESLTEIGGGAFASATKLKSVEIPNNVKKIGANAFWKSGIERVTIDADTKNWASNNNLFNENTPVKTVVFRENASASSYLKFDYCTSVTSFVAENNPYFKSLDGFIVDSGETKLLRAPKGLVNAAVPEGISEIGDYAFMDSKTESVTLPSTLKTVGQQAFAASKLKSLNLPDGVTRLNLNAFQSCKSLTEVYIGEGLSYVGNNPFKNCTALSDIRVSENNQKFYAERGSLVHVTTALTYGGNLLVRANLAGEIPEGVVCLDGDSFYDCAAVESVNIPASVKQIEIGVFSRCKNLKSVTFADKAGWVVTENGKSHPKDSIAVDDLTDTAKNAEYCTVTYKNFWWKKG